MSNRTFQSVNTNRPGLSAFDLSYTKTFTCDMGQLVPVMCDEMVPGDIFKVGNQAVLRMQPLLAPILHEINVYTHYFFVPYRLLWDHWEDFITGGVEGNLSYQLPIWHPGVYTQNSIWDYLGFPLLTGGLDTGAAPCDFPLRAYRLVWNFVL